MTPLLWGDALVLKSVERAHHAFLAFVILNGAKDLIPTGLIEILHFVQNDRPLTL